MDWSDRSEALSVLVVDIDRREQLDLADVITSDSRVRSFVILTARSELDNFLSQDKLRGRLDIILVAAEDYDGVQTMLGQARDQICIVRIIGDGDIMPDDRTLCLFRPLNRGDFSRFLDYYIREYRPEIEGGQRPIARLFLCHSSGDKSQVRRLYTHLKSDGYACWFDEEDLLGGQDFDTEISLAIERSHYVVACLSTASISKRGYIQKELKKALDVADEQPEGSVFLIPVRLEDCEIPHRLRNLHYIDLFAPTGYDRLVKSLQRRTSD